MFIFVYIMMLFIVYISTFKSDFKDESIDAVLPILLFMSIATILLGILGSL